MQWVHCSLHWLSFYLDQIIYLASIPVLAMFTLVKEYTNYLLSPYISWATSIVSSKGVSWH